MVLNKRTDADIIEHLETKHSKSEYIKRLIRKDISDPAAGGDQAHADHTETEPDAGNAAECLTDQE